MIRRHGPHYLRDITLRQAESHDAKYKISGLPYAGGDAADRKF